MASHARPNMPGKYQQGYYKLHNVDKYLGDPTAIVFRSSYERRFCAYCDLNPKIKKWGSEISTIPYIDPEGKERRYHVDFYIEVEDMSTADHCKRMLVEVKPLNETKLPTKPKSLTLKVLRNYEYALKMYQKNLCKWNAAKQYATEKGMQFVILTEKHLNQIKWLNKVVDADGLLCFTVGCKQCVQDSIDFV